MTDVTPADEPAIRHDLHLKLPLPRVTLVLVLLNIAAFAISAMRGAGWVMPEPDALVAAGGNLPVLTLNGEPWRLVTSMFLHGGLLHLAMNMICLWPGGQSAEFLFGRRSFLAIYLVAGLVGGLASTARLAMIVSVGASGAVFGVFGAILAYLLAHRDQLEPTVRAKQLKSLGTFMGINLVIGLSVAGIDLIAHVGGLVAGFVIAFVAERRLDLADLALARAIRLKRVVVASVVALGLVGVGLAVLPAPTLGYMTAAEAKSVEQFEQKIGRFVINERELLDKQNALLAREDLTRDEGAKVITEELVPRWRAIGADLDQVAGLPAVMVPRLRAVIAYATARVAHLEALAAMLVLDPSAPELAAAQDHLKEKSRELEASLATIERLAKAGS